MAREPGEEVALEPRLAVPQRQLVHGGSGGFVPSVGASGAITLGVRSALGAAFSFFTFGASQVVRGPRPL